MGDVSVHAQLLKQRFSIWFNKSHDRYGTLWSERYKSVLLDGEGSAVKTCAAYVDLNPVRAGLVGDPKDYRFCGYAQAVAGDQSARAGIGRAFPALSWDESQAGYRQILFAWATVRKDGAAGDWNGRSGRRRRPKAVGCLSRRFAVPREILYGRGCWSKAFVAEQLAVYRRQTGRGQRTGPRRLPPVTDWTGLAVLRELRSPAWG